MNIVFEFDPMYLHVIIDKSKSLMKFDVSQCRMIFGLCNVELMHKLYKTMKDM